MPLKKLSLKNFQVHATKSVAFDKRNTTLVGDNDSGKTTILRALLFLTLNQGDSKELISWGKEKLSVELEVDGHTIKRVKGDKVNAYYLDGKKYVSFGRGKVPKPIETALNLSSVNFQHQFALPFWFMDSPGQVSKNLNEIVNLDVIDKSLSEAANLVKKAKARLELSKERFKNSRKELKELDWVPDMADGLVRIRRLDERAVFLSKRARLLIESISEGDSLLKRKDGLKTAILEGRKAIAAGVSALQARRERKSLERSIEEENVLVEIMETGIPDISELLSYREKADIAAERRRELEMGIEEQVKLQGELCQCKREAKTLRKQITKFQSGICPTCNRPIGLKRLSSATSTSDKKHQQHEQKSPTGCPF